MRAILVVINKGLKYVMVMLLRINPSEEQRDKGGQRPRGEQFSEEQGPSRVVGGLDQRYFGRILVGGGVEVATDLLPNG